MSEIGAENLGLPEHYPFNPEWEVAPADLACRIRRGNAPDLVILDCRMIREVEIVRIEGSIHIPMAELSDRLAELEEHQDSEIIVYCHHGQRSLRVTGFLRQQGFASVKSLAGGIDQWAVSVEPGLPRY